MADQADYNILTKSYADQLRGLFKEAKTDELTPGATRGIQTVAVDNLEQDLENFKQISQQLGTASQAQLNDKNTAQKAEFTLLTQAVAEMDIALELLQLAQTNQPPGGSNNRSANLIKDKLTKLADALDKSTQTTNRKSYQKPANLTKAREQLTTQAKESLQLISAKAAKTCWTATQELASINTDILQQALALTGQAVSALATQLMGEATGLLENLVKWIVSFLGNVYNWVISLLGPDLEKKVRDWIESQITQLGMATTNKVVKILVENLYDTKTIHADIEKWLATTQEPDKDKLYELLPNLDKLYEDYNNNMNMVDKLLGIVKTAKSFSIIQIPHMQILLSGVLAGIMGYTLLSGYDYTGNVGLINDKLKGIAPNRVDGVRETIGKALGIQV